MISTELAIGARCARAISRGIGLSRRLTPIQLAMSTPEEWQVLGYVEIRWPISDLPELQAPLRLTVQEGDLLSVVFRKSVIFDRLPLHFMNGRVRRLGRDDQGNNFIQLETASGNFDLPVYSQDIYRIFKYQDDRPKFFRVKSPEGNDSSGIAIPSRDADR